MKILVCSDSHNRSITKLPLDDYEFIIHCGDILESDLDYFKLYPNLYYVRGNCDYSDYQLYKIVNIANKSYFITHSHLYNTKYTYEDLINNTKDKYDFVLFGHTHKQVCFKIGNTIYINPGAYKNGEYAYIEDDIIYLIQNNKAKKIRL